MELLAELPEHKAGGTEISHKKLFKKVIQVCLEEQCFCGAGLALPFASSLSVVTLQDQQQDCQGQC